MPILENIKVAEKESETLRANAHKQVEELLEQTRLNATKKSKEIIEEAHKRNKIENKETEDLIKTLEKENQKKIEVSKANLDSLANNNNKVGVNYILKQVIEV